MTNDATSLMDYSIQEKDLSRSVTLRLSLEALHEGVDERLLELQKTVNLKGFRVGKVPLPHLRRLFGGRVLQEVFDKQLKQASDKLLKDLDLRPVMTPRVHVKEDQDFSKREGAVEVNMEFDVLPRFTLVDLSSLSLERPTTKITPAMLKEELKTIKQDTPEYHPAKKEHRVEMRDRVLVNFSGTIDGKPFDGGKGRRVLVVPGSGQFLGAFEKQFTGMKLGEKKSFDLVFPTWYGNRDVAGRTAVFDVEVLEFEKAQERDDASLKKALRLEEKDSLEDFARSALQGRIDDMSRLHLKKALFDKLDSLYSFELPQSIVDVEFNQIWSRLLQDMTREGETFETIEEDEEFVRKEYMAVARRRVRLGLVLGLVGESLNVTVSNEQLAKSVFELAGHNEERARELWDRCQQDPNILMQVRGPIFEVNVIESIFNRSGLKVVDVEKSFEELMEEPEAFAEPPEPSPKKKSPKKESSQTSQRPKASKKSAATDEASAKAGGALKATSKTSAKTKTDTKVDAKRKSKTEA